MGLSESRNVLGGANTILSDVTKITGLTNFHENIFNLSSATLPANDVEGVGNAIIPIFHLSAHYRLICGRLLDLLYSI